ncbi:MAG: glutamine--fructose-6-phosphate aminotransferase, partial [Gammaproteobacteria bacterium]
MCGIVAAIAQRDVAKILIEGLKTLEYRGYDSAGMAVLSSEGAIQHIRRVGKVAALAEAVKQQAPKGGLGIAHTRWATHGQPTEENAHPHLSEDRIAIVHNGIIENHHDVRERLKQLGYQFQSETDTEVIAHLIHHELNHETDLLGAVRRALSQLQGAYAIAVIDKTEPNTLIVAREGSPLVIGLG